MISLKPLTKATSAAWTALAWIAGGSGSAATPREPLEATTSPSPSGACGSSSVSFESTRDWKTAPRPATPVAIPTWRKVVLIPEPIPDFSTGTTAIAAWPIPGLVMPMPMPATMKPTSSVVHSESGETPCISSSPSPTTASPVPSRTRIGILFESTPEIGATMKPSTVSGRKRSPASSGE